MLEALVGQKKKVNIIKIMGEKTPENCYKE